jgi:hypothetical protein
MTTGLYGTGSIPQNVPGNDTTSLYGASSGAPVPSANGDLVVRGNLAVLGGNITTTAQTATIFNTNATNLSIGGAATTLTLGAAGGLSGGTTTIQNNLVVLGAFSGGGGSSFGNIVLGAAPNLNTISTTTGNLKLNATSGIVEVDGTNLTVGNTNVTNAGIGNSSTLFLDAGNGVHIDTNSKSWFFNPDASTVMPGSITAGTGNTMTLNPTSNSLSVSSGNLYLEGVTGVHVDTGGKSWYFNTDGSTHFPNYIFPAADGTTNQVLTTNGSGTLAWTTQTTGVTSLAASNHLSVNASTGAVTVTSDATDAATPSTIVARNSSGDTTVHNLFATYLYSNSLQSLSSASGTGIYSYDVGSKFYVQNGVAQVLNNGFNWYFNTDGTTQFPNYKFPSADGATNQVLRTNGSGTLSWYSPTDTTYTFSANSVSGGANLNLLGSDSSTNTVKLASGTGITVADVSSTQISITNTGILSVSGGGHITATTASGAVTLGSDATNSNIANTIVSRDGSGGFGAGNITASLTGNASTATALQTARNIQGVSFNGTADITVVTAGTGISVTGTTVANTGVTALSGTNHISVNASTGSITVTSDGTSANTVSTLVARDANGDFAARIVTAVDLYASVLQAKDTVNNLGIYSNDATAHINLANSIATVTNGSYAWGFNSDGTTSFPSYKFPQADGSANQVLKTNGAGILSWYTPSDLNTTYTYTAGSTTGGANLTLTGSDSTTNTVKLTNGGHITATYTSGTAVALSSDATTTATASVLAARDSNANLFANSFTPGWTSTATAAGTTTLTVASTYYQRFTGSTTQTVVLPDATTMVNGQGFIIDNDSSGNLTLQANGGGTLGSVVSGMAVFVFLENNSTSAGSWSGYMFVPGGGPNGQVTWGTAGLAMAGQYINDVQGIQSTTDSTYSFPAPTVNTVSNNNGFDTASSFTNTILGDNASNSIIQYFGDTLASTNVSPAQAFKSANGNSITGSNIPFTGVSSVAPSAVLTNNVLGTLNFSGYATTGFADAVATMAQGGGLSGTQPLQIQAVASETFADGTLTISGATITAVTRTSVALASVSVTGTKGQISFTSTSPAVGNAIVVTGTNTGSSTGITAGTYYVIVTNGSTTATLSATPGGTPITTTAGTTTGLTFTRQFITVTYSAQSNIPFGLNAKVAVANITNVTDGTYMVMGTSGLTSVNIGAPSSGSPTLPGTQSLSLATVTAAGAFLRVRAMPPATTVNSGNRVELINHSTTAATYRADTFNISAGAYGATGVNYAQFVATGATVTGTGIAGTFIRTGSTGAQVPAALLRYSRTDQTGPQDSDGVDFRFSVGGTSTTSNFGRVDGVYKSSGLNEIGISVSTDSFATNTNRIYVGTRESTKINATPSGGGSVSTIVTATDLSVGMARAVAFANYTTTQRNALSPAAGWVIWNTTTVKLECYDGATWQALF